jgi:hypothetical protein
MVPDAAARAEAALLDAAPPMDTGSVETASLWRRQPAICFAAPWIGTPPSPPAFAPSTS